MKAFAVSLALLFLLSGAVTVNHIYINEVSDRMTDALEGLPTLDDDGCGDAVGALSDYWKRQVEFVSLSVSYTIVDRICEHTATLIACVECGDRFGFYTALALLEDAVGDMRRFETPSFGTFL